MTRGLRRALIWAVGTALLAVVAGIVRPHDRALILDVYLLFAGGLALLLLVAATAAAFPPAGRSRLELALRGRATHAARPAALLTLERRILLSVETAVELHYRLRPILREVAAYRLSAHRAVDLDEDVDAARDALGPEAWELVRPDRPPPADRLSRGCPLPDLRAAVDGIERI